MQHLLGVAVSEACDNLAEQVARAVLLELAPSAHVGQQISATAHAQHEYNMLLCLKALVKPYYVGVPCPAQDVELLHDFAFGGFFRHYLLVDGLEGDELAT